jgi:hypothetical protein
VVEGMRNSVMMVIKGITVLVPLSRSGKIRSSRCTLTTFRYDTIFSLMDLEKTTEHRKRQR